MDNNKENTYSLYLGNVISVKDDYDGCRIRVKVNNIDQYDAEEDIPYAFPLLPKHLQVKPKVGENVIVLLLDPKKPKGNRFYIGPIISQPQNLYKDTFELGSTNLMVGGNLTPSPAINNDADCEGVLPKDGDVAILGRMDSDIILSDNDLRIRCGVKKVNETDKTKMTFNRINPSFIKLKMHDEVINEEGNSRSSASIVADEINLIANQGIPYVNAYDRDEQITDEAMKKLIASSRALPYGDTLVEFLRAFLQMFKSHTHRYSNLPPCKDKFADDFEARFSDNTPLKPEDKYFNPTKKDKIDNVAAIYGGLEDKLLNKHIRMT